MKVTKMDVKADPLLPLVGSSLWERAVVFPPVNSCAINTQRERLEIFYSASFTILEENIAEYRTQQVTMCQYFSPIKSYDK